MEGGDKRVRLDGVLKWEMSWRNACVCKDMKPERRKTSGFVVAKEALKALIEW